MRRRIDDLSLARRCADEGLAGFVLKSHYVPTAERAAVVRKAAGGADVRGALLERCFTTPHTGRVSWAELFEHIATVGPEHSLLSSDLGQPFNPPVEDGLALMADRLLEAGFGAKEITTMAVRNSRWLMGAG